MGMSAKNSVILALSRLEKKEFKASLGNILRHFLKNSD